MCKWGTTLPVTVTLPAHLSSTGRKKVCIKQIDACIAPIVEALNAGGIQTYSSCCGHGKGDGSIALSDGRELVVRFSTRSSYMEPVYGGSNEN